MTTLYADRPVFDSATITVDKATAHKRTSGSGAGGAGVLYFMVSHSNVVTADESDYVAVKIGLASGGEKATMAMLEGHQTSNDGDTEFIALVLSNRVKATEAIVHERLRNSKKCSTVPGPWSENLPEEYRHLYNGKGGTEWFILTRQEIANLVRLLRSGKFCRHCVTDVKDWHLAHTDEHFIGHTVSRCPITFYYTPDGWQVKGHRRQGGMTEKSIQFALTWRRLTGCVPKGCLSTAC
tara:strand:+ start:13161 stop:13874 length:714 start_codon:yes stop_codon:yes gene_type:complete